MEVEITPECLSREELVHELTVRGTVVSDADPVEELAFNLKVFLSMERDGILFETGVKLDPERELTRCREILDEIRTLFTRVLDETILRTAATKLAPWPSYGRAGGSDGSQGEALCRPGQSYRRVQIASEIFQWSGECLRAFRTVGISRGCFDAASRTGLRSRT
ncbi:hypothetical protein MTP99_015825 [Tenebrio molitor]|nr:hypothetical protein MTP99_015825 [Tenebrio molitor]